jgi:thiol-disulfide isomerase/thioredoxin
VLLAAGLVITQTSGAAAAAPAIIRIPTSEGTLVVQVDDPGISVRVERGEVIVTGAGPKELRLRASDLNTQNSANGKPLETAVSITRGDKEILSIRRGDDVVETAAEAHPATKRLFNSETGHDYQRIDVPMTWHEAKKYCEQLGGHLATATTAEENAFIYSQFGRDHVCWLGATDEKEEGTWAWITDEPWDYENWYAGEPSNNHTDGGAENYLVLGDMEPVMVDGNSYFYRFGAQWNDHVGTGDYHGTSIAYAVCEWDEHDPQKAVEATPLIDEMASIRELQRATMSGASVDETVENFTVHLKTFPDSPRNNAVARILVMMLTRGQDEQQSIDSLQKLTESDLEQLANAATARIEQLEQMLELKKEPIELKFAAVDGREFDIADYRGKVVLIDFWATWCGPCVAGMPEIIELYKTHHEQGFEIVGISFDSDKEALEKFVSENDMPWVQFFDGKSWDNEYGRQYGINAIPTMWLVGRDGKVVDFSARMNVAEKVKQLVEE